MVNRVLSWFRKKLFLSNTERILIDEFKRAGFQIEVTSKGWTVTKCTHEHR